MLISVDTSSGLAIYDQIVRQIKFTIASGALLPGELVPSVRELSKNLAVNPNTVARAYRELQSESVLETIRGTGLEVTKTALKKCRADRVGLIRERLKSVLKEAQHSQLAFDEIRELTESELSKLNGQEQK
jgi:GntR family transcriptional regulator